MTFQWITELPPALITASAAFVGGILGTLLTIFVTPRLQHYFWKRQKREEIRRQYRRMRLFRPHRCVMDLRPFLPFSDGLRMKVITCCQLW